jgi:phosphoglycolate phosphatase
MKRPSFRAVIFDLDGTLADSLGDLAEAMNLALSDFSLPTHPEDAYRLFVGEGVDVMVRHAAPPRTPDATLERLVEAYRAHYGRLDHPRTAPYEGIPALLDALTQTRVPMAVLSNKRDDFTKALINKRFGAWSFVEVRGEQKGVPKKPDPTAALAVAATFGVAPGEVVFVGDTAIDMRTASNAGMRSVGCLWGFRSRAELVEAKAQHLIETPIELMAV